AGSGVRTFTFGELNQRAARMVAALRRRGIAPGDRVAVRLSNGIEFIDLFLACIRLGAVIVPINVLYREREIAHIVADADPATIVTDAESLALFAAGSPTVDARVLMQEAGAARESNDRPDVDGDAPAAIVYTSGTTGRSKGAVLSHNNFLA